MKKLSKLLALVVGVASLFYMSCSDVSEEASGTMVSGISNSASVDKDYGIQLFAEDGAALDLTKWGVTNDSADSSRTIVAEGLGENLDDSKNKVTFWLWGNNQLNSNESISNPKNVAFTLDTDSTTTGKVTLGLSASRWNLTLAACDASKLAKTATPTAAEVRAAAYYIGYANVDLRSANTLKFYLSADGLTGTASAELTFRFDGMTDATTKGTWTKDHADAVIANYTISADITSRLQNATSSPQTVDVTKFLPETPAATQGSTEAAGAKVTWGTLNPGTYNLEVKFTRTEPEGSSDLTKSYVWSDIIIVLPNQKIVKDINVPDVILYKPTKPGSFKVGCIKPTISATNTYNAVLAWTDSSNNETYFEVQYANLDGSSTALTAAIDDDSKWKAQTDGLAEGNVVKLGETFYGNTNLGWIAGSLVKNNKAAVVKLSLGKRYLFRIAAVNAAGHSDWVYATYDLAESQNTLTTGGSTANYTPVAYSIYKIDTDSKDYAVDGTNVAICANLYRLTYHMNGGSYYFKDTTAKTTDAVYWLSQKPEPTAIDQITTDTTTGQITVGIPILTPDGKPDATSPVYSYLIKDSNLWTSWRRNAVEGNIYQNSSSDYPSYSATDPTPADRNGQSRYLPDGYLGYQNLDLFASYTVGTASVEIYNDITYDFKDGELAITGATKTNDKAYTFTYTNSTSTTALSINYTQATADKTSATAHQAAFKYDSISVSIVNVASNAVVAVGTLDPSNNTYSFDIAPFGDGKFNIRVCGEYKGKQYSYGIVLEVIDNSTPSTTSGTPSP